jgi:hypothetical protein
VWDIVRDTTPGGIPRRVGYHCRAGWDGLLRQGGGFALSSGVQKSGLDRVSAASAASALDLCAASPWYTGGYAGPRGTASCRCAAASVRRRGWGWWGTLSAHRG